MSGMQKTARCRIRSTADGTQYDFYCDVSGAFVCAVGPVCGAAAEEDLKTAWEAEGRKHFNLCRKCGRWVSDPVYNVETLECVECSPWEEEPVYCPHCGSIAKAGEVFCSSCSKRLRYGMETTAGKAQ